MAQLWCQQVVQWNVSVCVCVQVCVWEPAGHGYMSIFSLCSLLGCCLLTARGPDCSKAPASTEETPAALSARYCPLTHCRFYHAKQHKHRFHSDFRLDKLTKRMVVLFTESYNTKPSRQPSHAIGGTHESRVVCPFQQPLCTKLDSGILTGSDRRKSFLFGHSAERITRKQDFHTHFNFHSFCFWFPEGVCVEPCNSGSYF